jgi:hypothetical protein
VRDDLEMDLDAGARGEAVPVVVPADRAAQGGVVVQGPLQVRGPEDRGDADLRVLMRHAGQTATVAVLIDSPVWPWRGRRWSHLVSDTSYDELHTFVATELGIPRRAFQGDHYDIPEDLYDVAVAAGAQPVGARELLSRLMAAGLRIKKPRPGG